MSAIVRFFRNMFGYTDPFTWDNKVVSYHIGCFCPPHIGHYDSIKNAVNELNADMKNEDKVKIILIKSIESEKTEISRHGINRIESQNIWKSWSTYLSQDTGCHVIIMDDVNFSMLTVPNTIKRLYKVRIIEGRGDKGLAIFEKERLEKHKKYIMTDRSYLFPLVSREKIFEAIFYRTVENGISATNFTKCLMEGVDDCTKFVPERLSASEKKDYISFLKTHKLWEKIEEEEEKKEAPNTGSNFWNI